MLDIFIARKNRGNCQCQIKQEVQLVSVKNKCEKSSSQAGPIPVSILDKPTR